MTHRPSPSLLILLIIIYCTGVAFGPSLAAATFSQAAIDNAVDGDLENDLVDYTNRPVQIQRKALRMLSLAVIARHQPEATSSDDIGVVAKWAAHARNVVSGEDGSGAFYQDVVPTREPRCLGGGATEGWRVPAFAYALALGRRTPVLWDALTANEQERVAWVMRALAVAGHWTFDDENNAGMSLDYGLLDPDGDPISHGFNKGHGPNHQSGYMGVMLAAQLFFADETDGLAGIFADFDHASWVARFKDFGWRNVTTTWDRPLIAGWLDQGHDGETEPGIGPAAGIPDNPFTYYLIPAGEPLRHYAVVNDRTFFWNVSQVIPTSADIQGDPDFRHVTGDIPTSDPDVPGSDDLRNRLVEKAPTPATLRGERGMLKEFWIGDAKGLRSSLRYSAQGWTMELSHLVFALESGIIDPAETMCRDLLRRFHVGTEDLRFKGTQGWQESSQTWDGDQYWSMNETELPLYEQIVAPQLVTEPLPSEAIAIPATAVAHLSAPMTLTDDHLTIAADAGNHPAAPEKRWIHGAGGADGGTATRDAAGTATFLVDCDKTDTYWVWAEVQAGNGSDSVFLAVESFGGEDSRYLGTRTVDFPMALAADWSWQRGPQPLLLRGAEINNLLVAWREAGVRIRRLWLTDDPDGLPPAGTWTPGNGLVAIAGATATNAADRAVLTIDGWHRTRGASTWGLGEDEDETITWTLASPSLVRGIGLASPQDDGQRRFDLSLETGDGDMIDALEGAELVGLPDDGFDVFRDHHFDPVADVVALHLTPRDRWLNINEVRVYGNDQPARPLGSGRTIHWRCSRGETLGWLRQDQVLLYQQPATEHRAEGLDPLLDSVFGCQAPPTGVQ